VNELERAVALRRSHLGPSRPDTLNSVHNLALGYLEGGRISDAIKLYEEILRLRESTLAPDHLDTLESRNNLVRAYLEARRWAEAKRLSREFLRLREKRQPGDWWRFHTMSQLGAALAGQKKSAEAEPLILEGYRGMKAREAKIPVPHGKKLAEAAARIVTLYEAWGKVDKAAEWRRNLETAAVR
jgi:tetratricopeptide (TPR) repeat protein